jgi:DNA-nicking Smr family endonuclease
MTRRRLNDEERALWRGVTRSISPLRKASAPAETDQPAPPAPSPPAKARRRAVAAPAPVIAPKPPSPPPLAPLGRKMKQRIARGRRAIDGRLDLHGMTQAEAHDELLGFLHSRRQRGAKLVLVITGKGSGDAYAGRGVLKRLVPMWLALPEFRNLVIGFESAAIGHGGEGALYVSLRRTAGIADQ